MTEHGERRECGNYPPRDKDHPANLSRTTFAPANSEFFWLEPHYENDSYAGYRISNALQNSTYSQGVFPTGETRGPPDRILMRGGTCNSMAYRDIDQSFQPIIKIKM
jgi:hypothetical protein